MNVSQFPQTGAIQYALWNINLFQIENGTFIQAAVPAANTARPSGYTRDFGANTVTAGAIMSVGGQPAILMHNARAGSIATFCIAADSVVWPMAATTATTSLAGSNAFLTADGMIALTGPNGSVRIGTILDEWRDTGTNGNGAFFVRVRFDTGGTIPAQTSNTATVSQDDPRFVADRLTWSSVADVDAGVITLDLTATTFGQAGFGFNNALHAAGGIGAYRYVYEFSFAGAIVATANPYATFSVPNAAGNDVPVSVRLLTYTGGSDTPVNMSPTFGVTLGVPDPADAPPTVALLTQA